MKRVATLILNRNLPVVTDSLYEHLMSHDQELTDIYVVDAGSEVNGKSKYTSWSADWDDAILNGLRYWRGMNFGLSKLFLESKLNEYDAFLLLSNDTELEKKSTISPLMDILDKHPRLGILSPCSKSWGEWNLLQEQTTKYFWFIHNNAYLLRREFIESIMNYEEPNHLSFIFDGSNFRGYCSESELIAKAYANDWAAAITSEVVAGENEYYLHNQSSLIRTEGYEENLKLYVDEGKKWMLKKYGFNSRWTMQQYVRGFYREFFEFHPEYAKYKV